MTTPQGATAALALVRDLLADPVTALERHGPTIPELAAMRGCPQPPNHHFEGDVWAHTRLALAVLMDLERQVRLHAGPQLSAAGLAVTLPSPTLTMTVAVLLHDVGKPATIASRAGTWTYYGHESVGADMARQLLARLELEDAALRLDADLDVAAVEWLIRNHLFWLNTDVSKVSDRAVARRFVDDPHRGDMLRVLNWCDVLGSRNPNGLPHVATLLDAEGRLRQTRSRFAARAAAPPPVLNGDVVMQLLGIDEGRRVGIVLGLARRHAGDDEAARRWLLANAAVLQDAPLEVLAGMEVAAGDTAEGSIVRVARGAEHLNMS